MSQFKIEIFRSLIYFYRSLMGQKRKYSYNRILSLVHLHVMIYSLATLTINRTNTRNLFKNFYFRKIRYVHFHNSHITQKYFVTFFVVQCEFLQIFSDTKQYFDSNSKCKKSTLGTELFYFTYK